MNASSTQRGTTVSAVQPRVSKGPKGWNAKSVRQVHAEKSKCPTDEEDLLWAGRNGVHCSHCGFSMTEDDKIVLFNKNDPRGKVVDFVRIPVYFDLQENPIYEDSDFVFCSPPCALGYMYDRPDMGTKTAVPDRFAHYMHVRYGITEPVVRAPSNVLLQYLWKTEPLDQMDIAPPMDVGVIDAKQPTIVDAKPHVDSKQPTTRPPLSTEMSNDQAARPWFRRLAPKPVGISFQEFHVALATQSFLLSVQTSSQFVPPLPNEHLALQERNPSIIRYLATDGLPEHIVNDLKNISLVNLDANPDSDTETDCSQSKVWPSARK